MTRLWALRAAVWATCTLSLVADAAVSVKDTPFTGSFGSDGRACNGGLHVRSKTLEWISTYRICKPGSYRLVEKDLSGRYPRIVFRIKNHSRQCGLEVVELMQVDLRFGQWHANAYPSMEAYEKRDQPGWIDSEAPDRQALSCVMFENER